MGDPFPVWIYIGAEAEGWLVRAFTVALTAQHSHIQPQWHRYHLPMQSALLFHTVGTYSGIDSGCILLWGKAPVICKLQPAHNESTRPKIWVNVLEPLTVVGRQAWAES